MCAGVTTFNALRRSRARGGDVVAVLGLGGLGHLGVQFAAKLGFETVAVARGDDKRELALRCGAHHYIDSTSVDPGPAIAEIGGATVLLSTVTAADAIQNCLPGVGRRGEVILVGSPVRPLRAFAGELIGRGISITGHASGTARDSEDTLRFSALSGVRPMIETMPLESVEAAYSKMMDGAARFRMVLLTGP
jgi:propanol-preferring alcohol dehydrogenase